ncbi:uncharacterized protein cubi_00519 [Cryptosporidium ubiquitum]|uniref:Uncharacterized protein n=1 Tax=Cryptosporidium ubiquitum TaxID=857276 RepID=A0A1J4MBV4_9CRYT|nr:uncharacterized protein cubi_00519 [Cryptosporidium ubiquitum]OII71712.1 hypothetical protein cubi_00519 [Cryptosporidium ubiquitum]
MNHKFVLEIDKNDNLIEFVRYVLSSRSSSVPKLSLPILDRNPGLPQFLKPEKPTFERYTRDHEKIKFFNKCLQIKPLYPEKCNHKFIFKYSDKQPERCSHAKESIDKKKNFNYSNKEINSISNYKFGPINKGITPLRERVCLACKKNSLTKLCNQKKNKHAEKRRNNFLDYPKTVLQSNEIFEIDELCKYLLDKNSKKLIIANNLFKEPLDSLYKTKGSSKRAEHFSESFIKNTIKSPNKLVQKMSISINNTETNEELHSQYFKKNYLQLLNTDPINFRNDSLTFTHSIERLSI